MLLLVMVLVCVDDVVGVVVGVVAGGGVYGGVVDNIVIIVAVIYIAIGAYGVDGVVYDCVSSVGCVAVDVTCGVCVGRCCCVVVVMWLMWLDDVGL